MIQPWYADAIMESLRQPGKPQEPRKRGRKRNAERRRQRSECSNHLRAVVLERDGGSCVCCGDDAKHVHHIVPLSHGGDNSHDNMISLCAECHRQFHPHLPVLLFA